jgi:hypothetical protein
VRIQDLNMEECKSTTLVNTCTYPSQPTRANLSPLPWLQLTNVLYIIVSPDLPMFFEGLRELREPHAFIAEAGLTQMLQHGGHMILPGKHTTHTPNHSCATIPIVKLVHWHSFVEARYSICKALT